MFDRLDDMLIHYEELMLMLGDPAVTQDTKRFTRLMKEQADLAPIVEAYKQYKQAKQVWRTAWPFLRRKTMRRCARWLRKSCLMPRSVSRNWSMN